MAISVIIPSFKNPDYLDLCLRSATENQDGENEIIVVLDGFADLSQHVVDKYPGICFVENEENRGQTYSHNIGVTLASNEKILIVNDDNVFPRHWDTILEGVYEPRLVIAPNQMEPNPSIFRSFVIENCGRTPQEFDYEKFLDYADHKATEHNNFSNDGQTWPVFMNKKYYMAIGGIDASFPSPAVADHDFFMRLELIGLQFQRYRGIVFYHFAGSATKAKNAASHNAGEQASHEYFAWKWGCYTRIDPVTHSKFPFNQKVIRGVNFNGS